MQSLFQKNKVFVHVVLDPIGFGDTSLEASFAARYGCLVIIEKVSFSCYIILACTKLYTHPFYVLSCSLQVEQLEIGALVLIRGVGRVKVSEFKQVCDFNFLGLRCLLAPVFQFH